MDGFCADIWPGLVRSLTVVVGDRGVAEELAQARQAVAEAEAAALLAESEAQRAVRERVAELAVEREQARAQSLARTSPPVADRANPTVAPRSVLGNFVTRSPSPTDVADAQPVARQAPARPVPASRPPLSRLPASQPPAPRPIVERGWRGARGALEVLQNAPHRHFSSVQVAKPRFLVDERRAHVGNGSGGGRAAVERGS